MNDLISRQAAIAFARIMKWIFSTDTGLEDRVSMLFFANLIPGLFLTLLFISALSSATDLIGWIASPTASAVREIARLIK